jgi:hypothetical protein
MTLRKSPGVSFSGTSLKSNLRSAANTQADETRRSSNLLDIAAQRSKGEPRDKILSQVMIG